MLLPHMTTKLVKLLHLAPLGEVEYLALVILAILYSSPL